MDMLEPSPDEIRDWANSIIQFMIEYLGGLRDGRVIVTRLHATFAVGSRDASDRRKRFRRPAEGFSRNDRSVQPAERASAHVWLCAIARDSARGVRRSARLNAQRQSTVWRSAPAPVELERLTIDWIRQILGFNAEAGGLFVSGGSMAESHRDRDGAADEELLVRPLADVRVERDAFFYR